MSETAIVSTPDLISDVPAENDTSRRRLLALLLVLAVSFGRFITSSTYYSLHQPVAEYQQQQIGVFSAILTETTSLLLLWFVLSGQRRGWKDIGWKWGWIDPAYGVGLVLFSSVVSALMTLWFHSFYHSLTGHYMQPRHIHGIIGAGISALTLIFVLLNPVFEELIVRGYLMSEVMGFGGSPAWAVVVSVALQMSYHSYQGAVRGIALATTFTISSIYFAKTRNVAPLVFAHFCMDAYALIKLNT